MLSFVLALLPCARATTAAPQETPPGAPADATLPDADAALDRSQPGVTSTTALRGPVIIGVHGGYAFQTTVGQDVADPRQHGGSLSVVLDGAPIWAGFSGRLEAFVDAFPAFTPAVGSPPAPAAAASPRLVWAASPSLTYRFDDTAVDAVASIGIAFGQLVDGPTDADVAVGVPPDSTITTTAVGPTAGLLLRFPLTTGVAVDGRLRVEFFLGTTAPRAVAQLGLAVDPWTLADTLVEGQAPTSALLEAFTP